MTDSAPRGIFAACVGLATTMATAAMASPAPELADDPVRAGADKPLTTVTATRAPTAEPGWVQLAVEPARPPPETTNPWARGLIWGGSGVAAAGLVTGLVTYLAFAAPLEDPQPRSGADNDALLQTGRATGIVADAAVITGLACAAAGVVLWLAGVGEEEVR